MYFPDLSPCTYCGPEAAHKLLAVGWLDKRRKFSRGPVDREVFVRLVALLQNPWEPVAFMGWHECPFCRYSTGPVSFRLENTTLQLGIRNLFIPADGNIFVAPSLILHYIDCHDYAPPMQFCEALLRCPPMRSMAYMKAILANGGRELGGGQESAI